MSKNTKRSNAEQNTRKVEAARAFAEMMQTRNEVMRAYREVVAMDLKGRRGKPKDYE